MNIVVTGTRGIPDIMGGVETHCEELFPRLATKGHNITIVRRTSYVKDNLNEWKGVKLINIKCPKKKYLEAIVHTFKAINLAKRIRADIVHIHATGPAILVPYAKLRRMKVVFTHHGPDYDRAKWGKLAKQILKLGERMGCMFADKVIVISDVIKELIAQKYGRTKGVELIYNGVPAPNHCNDDDYFQLLGIEKKKYIFAMGRFVPEKNLHHIIEAFNRIEKQEYKLVLAGDSDFDDDYSRKLKKTAKEKGIILTGFIKGRKLQSLLTHSKCFVLASSHEGLPIALLEAMSYELPIIVSDIPANLAVGLNQECYFTCGNIQELAAKLKTQLNEKNHSYSYNMEKYDWNTIAEKVNQVYNSIK